MANNNALDSLIQKGASAVPQGASKVEFKENVITTYIKKIYDIYVNRYYFIGDDTFSKAKQKLFLATIFFEGKAAVAKIGKESVVCRYYPVPKHGVASYNADGTVKNAIGTYAFYKDISTNDYPIFDLNENNCAFFIKIGDRYSSSKSVYDLLIPWVQELSNLFSVSRDMNTQSLNKVLISNNNQYNDLSTKVEDITNFIIRINDQADKSQSLISQQYNKLKNTLQSFLDVVKFDVNLEAHFAAIEKFMTLILKMLGLRHTPTFKKERMINKEMMNNEGEFYLSEQSQLSHLEIFVENYNRVFETTISIGDRIADKEEEENDKLQEASNVKTENNDSSGDEGIKSGIKDGVK